MMSVGCGPQAAGQEEVAWRDHSASTEVQNYKKTPHFLLWLVSGLFPFPTSWLHCHYDLFGVLW